MVFSKNKTDRFRLTLGGLTVYGYADTDTRILIRGYGYADTDTRLRIRGYGYAHTDMRIRICGYGYADTDTDTDTRILHNLLHEYKTNVQVSRLCM